MKKQILILSSFFISTCAMAQNPSLEFNSTSGPTGQGPTTANQSFNFIRNANNPNDNIFTTAPNSISATFSLSNQQFITTGVNQLNRGMMFGGDVGGGNTSALAVNLTVPQGNSSTPSDAMFTSLAPAGSGGISTLSNYAINVFNDVEFLIGRPLNQVYYYGDLTIAFSRPVSNPVLQITGLGGSHDEGSVDHGFATQFEMASAGLSLTRLDGNSFFSVTSTTIVNNAAQITALSSTGAASGSVMVNGINISSITLKVYVRGDNFGTAWGDNTNKSGDRYLVGISLQDGVSLSGNVLNDIDGLTDNMIDNNNGANAYGFTAGTLYANLFNSAGQFVAAVPVLADGTYNFASVAANTSYSVAISNTQGTLGTTTLSTFTPALPTGWANIGEGTTAAGDGLPNGITAVAVGGTNVTGVNFGIEQAPESYNAIHNITGAPVNGATYSLSGTAMQGSDPVSQPSQGSWAGKTLTITSVPNDGFELYYNNTLVTAGTVIANYNPALLSIKAVTVSNGDKTTGFQFAVTDAAGITDPTPATFTINFSAGLPVAFGPVEARFEGAQLIVQWQSLWEKNCDRYMIEASANGKDWQEIGSVTSKAPGGNSDISTNYEIAVKLTNYAVAGVSIAFLLLMMPTIRNRKLRGLLTAIFVVSIVACSKQATEQTFSKDGINFIRVVQYDVDGTFNYSQTIKVMKK